jgi:glucose-6-phosphate isomerase
MALLWHRLGNGRGDRQMVVLPYRDRLLLLPRYLQQLVMESLGKQLDRHGNVAHQGLTVYGNKGSTDQHAFVQQLRDGRDDFFALFVRVLEETGGDLEVESGVTCGDYLDAFLQGTRRALHEAGRPSLTIGLPRLDAQALGALIALFERAVGFYASLIDINAYHQPGVEAGKKCATEVIELQQQVVAFLRQHEGEHTAAAIALALECPQRNAEVFAILERMAMNPLRGVRVHLGERPAEWRFSAAAVS